MIPFSTPELLGTIQTTPAGKGALAVLCFSLDWQSLEQQTLWLACQLHQRGRAVALVVREGSPLQEQARAQGVPCLGVLETAFPAPIRTAVQVSRWLRQHAIGLLLTTRLADLGVAGLVKRTQPRGLRLLHRQLEPVASNKGPRRWWRNWQLRSVDAWLAPLARLGQQMLARTTLSGRQLWVVPPTLPPYFTASNDACSRQEGRQLLNLPAAPPLIGVLDGGGNGPSFALEVLYRLQQEHNSEAELLVMGGPATPPYPERWVALREQAQQLHLSHRLHLRPLHNPATPFLLYGSLDVLLLPGTQDATCLAVLYAMASGCPLVSAHTDEAAELLLHGHSARFFRAQDVATCAKQLFIALSAPAQSRLFAERAAAHARFHFDHAQQSQQVESILEYLSQPQAQG